MNQPPVPWSGISKVEDYLSCLIRQFPVPIMNCRKATGEYYYDNKAMFKFYCAWYRMRRQMYTTEKIHLNHDKSTVNSSRISLSTVKLHA